MTGDFGSMGTVPLGNFFFATPYDDTRPENGQIEGDGEVLFTRRAAAEGMEINLRSANR